MLFSILIFGHDTALLRTRELILSRERFAVVTTSEIAEAIRILTEQPVNLLILCHTLTDQECHSILAVARSSQPAPKVIEMVASAGGCVDDGQDRTLNIFDGPGTLVAAVHGLTDAPRLSQ